MQSARMSKFNPRQGTNANWNTPKEDLEHKANEMWGKATIKMKAPFISMQNIKFLNSEIQNCNAL